ncbi:hypothetical protein [Aeromicrobium sp. UC242_57]|uniref:hypothetical protein n=1 Tax=Aeromicrobium sp. UC242_57 TaxID=3374624 RepID=UPI0037A107C0
MSMLAGVVTTFIGYAVFGALTTNLLEVGLMIGLIAFVAGLIQSGGLKLIGPGMTVLSIILLILLGVPASGAGVPADMTPGFFADLQTLLPSSAALDGLRRIIYFDGTGIGPDVAAIAFWGLIGAAMIAYSRLKSPAADDAPVLESPFATDESLDEDEAKLPARSPHRWCACPAGVLRGLPAVAVRRGVSLPAAERDGHRRRGQRNRVAGGEATTACCRLRRLLRCHDRPGPGRCDRSAKDLEIRAAYDATTGDVYVSSAAGAQSKVVATSILTDTAEAAGLRAEVHDVSAVEKKDPIGTSLLYLGIGAIVGGFLAAVVTALTGPRVSAAWQSLLVLMISVVVAATEVLFGWAVFDIFSGHAVAAFGLLFAMALVSGLVTLAGMRTIGPAQIMVSVLILILAAVSSSGMAVRLDLAPSFYGLIHEVLPTSQGLSALRGAVYFDGAGVGRAVVVMAIWGLVAAAVIAASARRRPEGKHEAVNETLEELVDVLHSSPTTAHTFAAADYPGSDGISSPNQPFARSTDKGESR